METIKSTDLAIPIYLNQQIVFDMLATIEDGFSLIHTVETSSNQNRSQGNTYDTQLGNAGGIGISNVFALIGIGFKGEHNSRKEIEDQRAISEERVHTPSSLFAKLRVLLNQRELIIPLKAQSDFEKLKSGQFVEFTAILRPNPLISAFEGIQRLLEFADVFANISQPQKTDGGSHQTRSQKQKPSQKSEYKTISEQLDKFLTQLNQSQSIDLLGEIIGVSGIQAVLPTRSSYFINQDDTEIIDGEFSVLGKLTRVVRENDDPINLLRKTSMSFVNADMIAKAVDAFNQLEIPEFDLPKIVNVVDPPAVQLIPIAIFS